MSAELWSVLQGPVQIAYAVDDVAGAVESCVARGAGPFITRDHIEVANARIHGAATEFDHSSAYGQWGPVMVELICEHHELLDRVGPPTGIHHMAFFVDDFDHAQTMLIDNGWPEALYAEAATTRFAMHDARNELGHLIEIYEPSKGLLAFYEMIRSGNF